MRIEVAEEPATFIDEYGRIPIAFEISRIYDVARAAAHRNELTLSERAVEKRVIKDYDSAVDDAPVNWKNRFDVSNWGLLAARANGRLVGGAVVVFREPEIHMLEGRTDMAVLWDIRVAPDVRGVGVGSALLEVVERWSAKRGATLLKVETQNTNVPACRFYARNGFLLRDANRFAYPLFPDEIQLLWVKELMPANLRQGRPD